MKYLILLLFVTFSSQAQVFKIENDMVKFTDSAFMMSDLIQTYTQLEKLNIVFDQDFRDYQIERVGPSAIKKSELELYLSTMLLEGGYFSRILPETRTMSIFASRDVRYVINRTYTNIKDVPDTYEYVQFMLKLKNMDSARLARNMRPIMGRYGRIIDHTKSILIADTGKNVHRIMKIIDQLDTEEFVKSAEEVVKLNEKNKTVITTKKSFLQILSNNNIIFLVLFSLVGAIIGFGIRGYSMKRIEGGW